MSKSLEKIKQKLYSIYRILSGLFDHDPYKFEERIDSWWYILLCTGGALLLLALILHVVLYRSVLTDEPTFELDGAGDAATNLHIQDLERVLLMYSVKEKELKRALEATSTLVDPSR